MKNIKIDKNADRLLLVEGPDDEVFFLKLVEHMGIGDDIELVSYEGKDNLKRYLLAILNDANYATNRKHIGIVRDADYDTDTFASAVSALEHANRHQGASNEFLYRRESWRDQKKRPMYRSCQCRRTTKARWKT